jgi:hypothetical protein
LKPAKPNSKPAKPNSKPAKPTSRARSATAKPGHDTIAQRAYEISQTEPTGDTVSDWLKAEHELTPQPRPRRTRAQ